MAESDTSRKLERKYLSNSHKVRAGMALIPKEEASVDDSPVCIAKFCLLTILYHFSLWVQIS